MPFVAGNIYWITFQFIQPVHEKISLCICPDRPLFFWVNSAPKVHGVGQLLVSPNECLILNYDSYLDLSGVKTGSESEMQTARDAGPISDSLRNLILEELGNQIRLLPVAHRELALRNLA